MIPRAFFAPLGQSLSRIAVGTFPLSRERAAAADELLRAWLELGVNVLDTAPAYGDGAAELVVGDFLEAAGRRSDVVVITKGCHPLRDGRARVTPAAIHEDVAGSLARLRTSYIDIYMLHRDDPSASVGPLVEALNQEMDAGRIRSLGASNWTARRIEAANEFAARRGLIGFSSSSCQLSLAVQKEPLCQGCLAIHDESELGFYRRSALPLFAWSALAGGFFADGPWDDPDISRVYATPENHERAARAGQLAEAMGLSRTQVALAWVLSQAFPTFAIVATGRLEHVGKLADVADVEFSAEEVAWLDLGDTAPADRRLSGLSTEQL